MDEMLVHPAEYECVYPKRLEPHICFCILEGRMSSLYDYVVFVRGLELIDNLRIPRAPNTNRHFSSRDFGRILCTLVRRSIPLGSRTASV
jgi:hypothetical protein